MRTNDNKGLLLLVLCCGYLSAAQAAAQEIFKWVDEDGNTHYSEQPPETRIASLEILEVVSQPIETPPAGDFRTTLEVANNMQADRLERERLRLEKLKLEQQERQNRLDAMRYDEAYRSAYYYGPYYGYPYHRKPYGKHRGYPKPPSGHHPRPAPYPDGSPPKRVFNR